MQGVGQTVTGSGGMYIFRQAFRSCRKSEAAALAIKPKSITENDSHGEYITNQIASVSETATYLQFSTANSYAALSISSSLPGLHQCK